MKIFLIGFVCLFMFCSTVGFLKPVSETNESIQNSIKFSYEINGSLSNKKIDKFFSESASEQESRSRIVSEGIVKVVLNYECKGNILYSYHPDEDTAERIHPDAFVSAPSDRVNDSIEMASTVSGSLGGVALGWTWKDFNTSEWKIAVRRLTKWLLGAITGYSFGSWASQAYFRDCGSKPVIHFLNNEDNWKKVIKVNSERLMENAVLACSKNLDKIETIRNRFARIGYKMNSKDYDELFLTLHDCSKDQAGKY